MDAPDRQAEIVKLSQLLGCDRAALDFLGTARTELLRGFRVAATDSLFADGRDTFRRLAKLSEFLPAPLLARFVGTSIGPVLAGRVAGEMDPARAARLSTALPSRFLAECCVHMDPKRARHVIVGVPAQRIVDIALVLLATGELVTMARFVDVLAPEVLRRVIEAIPDPEVLLRIAFFVEDQSQLDLLISLFDDERVEQLVGAAYGASLWPEAIAMMVHATLETRRRLADVAARQSPEALEALVRSAVEHDMLPLLSCVVASMSHEAQGRIAALPVFAEVGTGSA